MGREAYLANQLSISAINLDQQTTNFTQHSKPEAIHNLVHLCIFPIWKAAIQEIEAYAFDNFLGDWWMFLILLASEQVCPIR